MTAGNAADVRTADTSVASFSFWIPTRIVFGRGCRDRLVDVLRPFGRRVALIAGRSASASSTLAPLVETLERAGLDVVARIVASGEPDVDAVLAAAATLAASRADAVVAIGGGSAIDLAKAAALEPSADDLQADLLGRRRESPGRLPVVALPTTAGSGSEASHAAIILDRSAARKRGIRGPGVAARAALVDPDLLDDLPQPVAASSGFDALAHAIETGVSSAATSHGIAWSGVALRELLASVPGTDGPPPSAAERDATAHAALLMGINLATSTTCLPHRLQYPLGARTGCGHAEGVAALMPAWLDRTIEWAPDRLARVAVAANLASAGESADAAARRLRDAVVRHLDATGMRRRLSDFGVQESDIPGLVDAVEGALANDPGPVEPADLRHLYLASM